jgi:hypothetical protein
MLIPCKMWLVYCMLTAQLLAYSFSLLCKAFAVYKSNALEACNIHAERAFMQVCNEVRVSHSATALFTQHFFCWQLQ